MPSTPFLLFLGSVLFLSWFTTDVHSEKVIDMLKGSSVVLSPGDAETSIISITWKHGADLAAEWFGEDPTFYRMFNDGCSLNTKTGELTINDVRPEHGGEYTPEINGKILSAIKLRVLYKVVNALKGSTVVLSPHLDKAEIISIKWKHGASLAADWIGRDVPYYRSFKDGCSLNTKTGELTINNLRPEHGGEYTPEINGQILSALKLQVFSPVPKPRITHDCSPEKTKCTLTCSFDRTDELGDVEVFWILDDRREKGTEIHITKDTKEETFICSLKNPVSSQNSTELKNPLLPNKLVNALKGSTVVLSPHLDKAEIISIKWKHGANLAADWIGRDVPFYRSFKDLCSLNTKTGELTINDVRPEHSGEYTPEINGQILSGIKLQVFSPVPKPRITPDCNPDQTNCTLTCSFDRTDDLGDVEVFWILDDRREKGTEIQITKDTKEETFICSLNNPVSSQNSTELKNPLLPKGRRLYFLLILLVIPLIGLGLFLIFHFKIHQKILRFIIGRNEQRSSAEERQNNGFPTNIPLSGSPAGGDAVHPEEITSLLETEEWNQTSNVTVTVEINPQTGGSDVNGRPRTRDPAEDPLNSSSSSSEAEEQV